MKQETSFDVIIIGGSYAGLAAAMSLGRALRKVLVIDSGKPCNAQTPHSHNFITQDGKTPKEIAQIAKDQVELYENVIFYDGIAIKGTIEAQKFNILTENGDNFEAKKLIFATGIKDQLLPIKGFDTCWGISIIHCPYCHGYEVRNERTGILANGDEGFEYAKLISNWTKELVLFTNGKSTLAEEQLIKLKKHEVEIIENKIECFENVEGEIQQILFKDGSEIVVKAIYARPPFIQHTAIPENLGCEMTQQGHIKVDAFQKTSIPGIYACGDNSTLMRSLASAVASGTFTGAMANKDLIEEEF